MNVSRSFHSVAFAPDGELIGQGVWSVTALSSRWLAVCASMLARHGLVFRASPGQALSHLEIKLTASHGSGLGMFFAHGHLGISTAYFKGEAREAETLVQSMLLESLRRTPLVTQLATTSTPFNSLSSLAVRPLHVFIPWGLSSITDDDYDLLHELANHFAGAFLCGEAGAA